MTADVEMPDEAEVERLVADMEAAEAAARTETGAPTRLSIELDRETIPDDVDPGAIEVFATIELVVEVNEAINEAIRAGEVPDGFTQDVVDRYAEAAGVAERLLEHREAFREDVECIPEELLDDVRRTIVPLGEAAGVDMGLDIHPDGDSGRDRRPTYGGAS